MKTACLLLGFFFVTLAPPPALSHQLHSGQDSSLNLALLLQAQAQSVQGAAPDGQHWSKDFFLRRARVLLFGNVDKNLSFFFETDQPNFGKNGDYSTDFFIQDAWLAYKFSQEVQLAMGMILLPFTRHSMQGAIALNGLDYNGELIKYPTGSHKVWRDMGILFYGWAFNDQIHYRLGVFGGSQSVLLQKNDAQNNLAEARSNPRDLPRCTGHLRYNILGKENDFFFKGIHFATEPILSVGMGFDFVPDAVLLEPLTSDAQGTPMGSPRLGRHFALAADVFLELPFNPHNQIILQGTWLSYFQGEKLEGSGQGFLMELGYRWKMLEPVLGLGTFLSEADKKDYETVRMGLNFFPRKHSLNLKAEMALTKKGDPAQDYLKSFTLQSQFFF